MRRLAAFAALAVLLAGCGGKAAAPTPNGQAPAPAEGNAAAGKVVFMSSGCAGCHTFAPAGTTATIGPNLDHLAAYAKKANESLADFTRSAITNPPAAYVPPGFKNVMPTNFDVSLTSGQLADVVAFLTRGA